MLKLEQSSPKGYMNPKEYQKRTKISHFLENMRMMSFIAKITENDTQKLKFFYVSILIHNGIKKYVKDVKKALGLG